MLRRFRLNLRQSVSVMNVESRQITNLLINAGKAICEIYESTEFGTERKDDNSPVTHADKASSRIINQGLKLLVPGVPVLDEEKKIAPHNERRHWTDFFLLDPLDGTKEFINKNGEFCINLARIDSLRPVEGWIYQPLIRRGWYCKKGEGIFEFDESGNYRQLETPLKSEKELRIVTSRSFFKPLEAKIIETIQKDYTVKIIHKGSSLKQLDVVKGDADLYLKAGPCSEWDTAPGQLMVEETGGAVIRHADFKSLRYNKEKMINPHFTMLGPGINMSEFLTYYKDMISQFY